MSIKYRARLADGVQDVLNAQALRAECFRGSKSFVNGDVDQFDIACNHVLIEDTCSDKLVACFRFNEITKPEDIDVCYSAQFYDLECLKSLDAGLLEIGRFCALDNGKDPAIFRVAWSFLTKYVDANNIRLMFGCSSFAGTDPKNYKNAFALLRERHLAERYVRPENISPECYHFEKALDATKPNLKLAHLELPSLLRGYLSLGAQVSDHAVIDRILQTLHVFTAVDVDRIPDGKKRLLRADAYGMH